MNRYWFNTNDGSRSAMLRIRMYPLNVNSVQDMFKIKPIRSFHFINVMWEESDQFFLNRNGRNESELLYEPWKWKNLIIFSDSRKKKMKLWENLFFFMVKNLSISSSLIPDKQRGSVESQVFFLTNRVLRLTQHLQLHGRDYSSQRGLWLILSKRKQLLVYLSKRDKLRYDDLIGQLSIRRLKTR